jgi:splicing factor U2AF 35 kDa subunit
MAKHLARIHGTEEDKVNCPFYFKIGACRHSDRCSRIHHKPAFSPTILIKHIYRHPNTIPPSPSNNEQQNLDDFLVFFEDMYMELSKYGRLDGLYVVDNVGDHLIGHVYAKFMDEEQAADALEKIHGRFYDGILIQCEYSPVTDFREARCRDYDEDTCSRSGFCNFLHVKPIPPALIRSLEDDAIAYRRMIEQEKDDERRLLKQQKSSSSSSHKRSSKSHNNNTDTTTDDALSSSNHHSSNKRSKRGGSSSHHHHHNDNSNKRHRTTTSSNSSNASDVD